MNSPFKSWKPFLLGFAYVFFGTSPVWADDTEIYFSPNANSTGVRNNILFVVDTSGSMGSLDGDSTTRMDELKSAFKTVLQGLDNVNVGLMRFSNPGGPVLYPVANINKEISTSALTGVVNKTIQTGNDDGFEFNVSHTVLLNTAELELGQDASVSPSAGAVNVQVPSAIDDAEYRLDNNSVQLYDNNLDMTSENDAGTRQQVIGVRFANVAIPVGATITSAYMQFVERDHSNSGTMQVEIVAEKVSGSSFDSTNNPNARLSNTSNITSAAGKVTWSSSMPSNDAALQTPDLTTMVQEVVSNGVWASGHAMTFLLKRPSSSTATGRIAFRSRDNSPTNQPRLIVNYTVGSTLTGSVTTALRFTEVNIPRGATITGAHLEFTSGAALSDPSTQVKVSTELSGNSLLLSSTSGDITGRTKSTAVTWDIADPWVSGSTYTSPSLTAQVKAVVDRTDWCGGNAMTFLLEGIDGRRLALAYESGSDVAPRLVVNYDASSVPSGTSCQQATLVRQISVGNDDAEENFNAEPDLTNGDLDIAAGGTGARIIGLRFPNISVPKNATIQSAYLQMRASEDSSASVNWTIKAQASDDAAAFAATVSNIGNRATTAASQSWVIGTSTNWVNNSRYTSPNVGSIVQELVNRGGWTKGNDMVFVISGTDSSSRAVDSFNGSSGNAPTLIINYEDDGSASVRTVRDELIEIVDSLSPDGYTPLQDTFYEGVQYFRGADVDYGKVRGNPAQRLTRVSHPDSMVAGTFQIHDSDGSGNSYDLSCINSSNSSCASEYIEGSAPTYKSPVEYACQANHIVLLTDGLPNSDHSTTKIKSLTGIGSATTCSYASGGACAPELAKWVNKTADISSTLDGDQRITVDTVAFYLEADGNTFLSDIAAEANGAGKFVTASSTAELVTALEDIAVDIKSNESSFVAAGAAVNAFNRTLNRDSLYFSVFKPEKTPKWPGNLKKYRLGFVSGEPVILDQDGQPAVDAVTGQFKAVPSAAQSYWSAAPDGPEIKLGGAGALITDYTTRKLYTNVAVSSDLSTAGNALATTNTALTGTSFGDAAMSAETLTSIINWTRGKDEKKEIDGTSTTGTRYVFADPLHSRPVAITYKGTDTNPDITIFVASNSGLLHAINDHNGSTSSTDDGKELFAFVPSDLLPLQKTLYDNETGVKHPYGLDGSITSWVIDPDGDGVVLDASGTVQAGNRVILVVGMGRGGKNYYALDVTDRAKPTLLWTIKGGTTGFEQMGETWSQPEKAMIKLGSETSPRRVLIMGGGYDPQQDSVTTRQSDSQGAAVYMVDLLTGNLIWKAGAGSGTEYNLNVTDMKYGIPAKVNGLDISGDGLIDYFFVGDMGGQVWRFDIHNGQGAASLVTGGVIADLGVASGTNVAANNRRFYNTPGVFLGKNSGTPYLGVLIGSGWRGHPLSESTTDRFYMIRQTSVFAAPSSYTKLTEANLFDATDNLIAQGTASEQTTATAALTAASGWYVTMTRSGEKVLTDPVVINGEVFFSTYEPSSEANVTNPCAVQTGTNWGYRVFATDARPSVDFNADGVAQVGERAESIPGTGIVGNPTLISTEDGHAMIRGTDTTPVNLGDLEKIKRVYWYENRAR